MHAFALVERPGYVLIQIPDCTQHAFGSKCIHKPPSELSHLGAQARRLDETG